MRSSRTKPRPSVRIAMVNSTRLNDIVASAGRASALAIAVLLTNAPAFGSPGSSATASSRQDTPRWDDASKAALGSGLVDQSQKMTAAASATAEKKTVGHRS